HVVLLVRARRQAVDRRGMGEDLVLRRERRGGVLQDHQPRIETGPRGEARGETTLQPLVEQERRPPLADRAQLRQGQLREVERERDRLALEAAAAEAPAAPRLERGPG